jgi:hypothetical protein
MRHTRYSRIVSLAMDSALALAPLEVARRIADQLEDGIDKEELAAESRALAEEYSGVVSWCHNLTKALFRVGYGGPEDSATVAARAMVAQAIEDEVALLFAEAGALPNLTDDEFWESIDFEEVCQDARAKLALKRSIDEELFELKRQRSHELEAATSTEQRFAATEQRFAVTAQPEVATSQPESATVQPEATTAQPPPAMVQAESATVQPEAAALERASVDSIAARRLQFATDPSWSPERYDSDDDVELQCVECDVWSAQVREGRIGDLLCDVCREAETVSINRLNRAMRRAAVSELMERLAHREA